MSIPVLDQVYAEARRLAVAGSVVAKGDFRLKKLVPPLEQAATQAPVFGKVAEAAKAVVDGPETKSAEALLELASLTSAVLYTQGETGIAGPLEPVETTALGGTTLPIPARELKPLLEALHGKGSGRLPPIKEAVEKGHFRDLRLVRPALAAVDDGYTDIADLVCEKALPLYGPAVLPELRATFDLKGAKGHPRRLKLMHRLDPAGTRPLLKEALEKGSKYVKVAAIACLGAEPEDRDYLIEQAASKTEDVREAAYHALARLDHPDAVAVLAKAVAGKDLRLASQAIIESKNPKLAAVLADEIRTSADAFLTLKDKKKASDAADRLTDLINALPRAASPELDAVLLDLFARRAELAKVKGATYSGTDVVEALVQEMSAGSEAVRRALAAAHADLEPDQLAAAFEAGRSVLPPSELHDTFAPYVTATTGRAKKKGKDPGWEKREAILDALDGDFNVYAWFAEGTTDADAQDEFDDADDRDGRPEPKPYDPRWLDVAVAAGHTAAVQALARPGHAGARAFARAAFDAALKKAKQPADAQNEVTTLLRVDHPDAADAFFAALERRSKKTQYYQFYWYTYMIPRLPAAAVPRLEAALAGFQKDLPESVGEQWQEAIDKLKAKHAPPAEGERSPHRAAIMAKKKADDAPVANGAAGHVLRAPAETLYAEELEQLVKTDTHPKPPGWRMSPRAVATYICGGKAGTMTVTPKYIGHRRLVEIAISTLVTDRALLLIGEPGTAKSWLSEHLAAAVNGDSTKVVQGTAGTTEEQVRYTWNYAMLIARGPSPEALIKSPIYRAMESGTLARFEEITRCAAEVQDALISILSEKRLAVPELATEVPAAKGFSVIATANTRDRGVNDMSAALKRRFNTVVLPSPGTLETEVEIVRKRVAELGAHLELKAAPPSEDAATQVVTIFRELRAGQTLDGKAKLKTPSGVLSTAEAISVLTNGMALAGHFGSGEVGATDLAAGLQGAVVKDEEKDKVVWGEYLANVLKKRGADWRPLYTACAEANS